MPGELTFPENFLWGSATSSHQVEGNNRHNDWWAWEQAGRVKEPSNLACDQYNRFAEDFELAAGLGHRAHRFSVEWSRIEPEEGRFDEAALAHYVQVVQALCQRGLEPVVTLHHFTSPLWLAKAGSWTNPKVVDYFARYVRQVARAIGSMVRYWMTINEPMVYVQMHYVDGVGPPGSRSLRDGLRVAEHLIRAHAAGYHVIHEETRGKTNPGHPQAPVLVSLAKAIPAFVPFNPWSPMDRMASALTNRLFNVAFLDAVTEGTWSVPGLIRRRFPEARHTLDYLGVNYYHREFIRWRPKPGQWLGSRQDPGDRVITERTFMGWDVCPEAFREVLRFAARWHDRLFVTENGISTTDDSQRWRFIARHLAALRQAMDDGVPVIGYLYWSLLDNFEWAHGFGPRFGLIEVDYPTQQRRVRESAKRYAEVCRTNRLTLGPRPDPSAGPGSGPG